MAIHEEQIQDLQGFNKEIEESAIGMIFDNLQRYQYQYPQKSTVRELVSNALDAVKEKQIAVSILKGESKVEDHFLHREDALYKDSNFDQSYYDLSWLWNDNNQRWKTLTKQKDIVYVTYVDGGDMDKDRLIIEDFGVGLGQKRIEGYFKLGYSTKRNTKTALGKFGIGAKAALSTAPYYFMTSRYNGREYKFQIFSSKISSVVPQFNLDTGESNGVHMFSNGAIIYYTKTDLPNGTIIEVESKKHHKQTYIEAVKSQLLYFDNVEFRVQNISGGIDVIPTKATILYEDDHIVLSDNNQYSKPHLLINKVNYGYVDFRELELEDKMGNIGIKVAAEDVSVNPSRESVMWDDITRETVINRFRKVVDIAGHMISEQLKVEDFIEWLKSCAELSARYSNSNSIVGRLSRIVDLSNVKPAYSKDPTVKYDYRLFQMLDMRYTTLSTERKGSSVRYKINREPAYSGEFAKTSAIVVMGSKASFTKDKYLLQNVYPDGFISIRLKYTKLSEEEEDVSEEESLTTVKQLELADELKIEVGELKDLTRKLEHFVLESSLITPYESIVVPEEFDNGEEVTEEQEEVKQKSISAEERRKLNGTIPVHTPRVIARESWMPPGTTPNNNVRLYEWQTMEIPVASVDDWDEKEVFFATDLSIGKDDDNNDIPESSLLHLAALLTRPADHKLATLNLPSGIQTHGLGVTRAEYCTHFFNPSKKLKLIRVAQTRRKYFSDFKPIQRFFMDIKNKTLTMSNALIRWNTARLIYEQLPKLAFLENFEMFHHDHCTSYRNLVQYVKENYRDVERLAKSNNYYGISDRIYSDLVSHCDKVTKLQLMVREHKEEPELIAKAVQEMFNPQQEVVDGCAVDIAIYDKCMELLDYASPVYSLFNELLVLTWKGDTGLHKVISEQLESTIREYLEFKGVKTC